MDYKNVKNEWKNYNYQWIVSWLYETIIGKKNENGQNKRTEHTQHQHFEKAYHILGKTKKVSNHDIILIFLSNRSDFD